MARITHRELKYGMSFHGAGTIQYSKRFRLLLESQTIPKTQMAQRQLAEYQGGGMSFRLGCDVVLSYPQTSPPLTCLWS